MNKIIIKILIGISIFIIAFGVFGANSFKSEILGKGEVSKNNTTDIVTVLFEFGTGLIGFGIICYSFSAVATIWVIYGIIYLVIKLIKKHKLKRNMANEEIGENYDKNCK